MGFKNQHLSATSPSTTYKTSLPTYYSQLFQTSANELLEQGYEKAQIQKTLLSIFSRTKIPTKTGENNRLLMLLDVDKIISLNERSLKENGEQVKHMRMIASLKHSSQPHHIPTITNVRNPNTRHFDDLVRLARLHMLQHMNRPRGEDNHQQQLQDSSEEEMELNPRMERLRELRMERVRNAVTGSNEVGNGVINL